MTKAEEQARGEAANRLMNDPLLMEAAAAQRAQYFEAWLLTEPGDVAARERLFIAATQTSQVFDHLRSVIASGRIAAQKLDRLKNGR